MLKRAPLVGRAGERAELETALDRCRNGRGGTALISGDSGVGKTRLVTEVLAGWDGCVLRAAATAGGGAYAPVAEVLRAAAERFGADLLSDQARALLPELGAPHGVDGPALVAAIRRTLRDVARQQPTVVVLEDLHWADAATTELLPALAPATEGGPLLLIGTYRNEALARDHPVRRMRTDLRRSGGLTEVALRPLPRSGTAELLSAALGRPAEPALLNAVHSRSDGLPFFIEELLAALVENGALADQGGTYTLAPDAELPLPDGVRDAVLVRTEGLRARHPAAVELAAVLGVRINLPVLADLVPAPEIDRLLDAGLIRERGPAEAEFRHALVRDALYRTIPWARRRGHHHLVADRLAEDGAPPEVVAEHWIAAHQPDRARPLLLAAAARHCVVHAYRDAAEAGKRALAIWPKDTDPDGRIAALEQLANCFELAGELDAAVTIWRDVASLREERREFGQAGSAYRRLANASGLVGDFAGGTTAREAAAEAFAAAGVRDEAAAEHLALAERLEAAARHTSALEHVLAATEDAKAAGRIDLEAHALAVQGSIRASLGEGKRGIELARSGLELALSGEFTEVATVTQYVLATALNHAADYAGSADVYESAIEMCSTQGATELEQACTVCMSVAVRFLGEWDRALAICRDVLDDRSSLEKVRMIAHEESGLIGVLRGERKQIRGPLRRAADFGRDHEVFGIEVGATWALAVIADLDGDTPGVLRTVSAMLHRCQEKEDGVFSLPALRWAATYAANHGERDVLAYCHRLLAATATRDSSPKVLSALAHAGGELALAEDDPASAAAQFGRSVELLRGVTAPYERALAETRSGAALAAAGDRSSAVDAVTSAYRIARQLGAKPLARTCATQLADMGEQVDRRLGRLAARTLEPAGLTRREKEVLRLLAADNTNRQIAQQLFVSTRTVDMHVRNLLTKLDCSSRTSAVRRARELGLVDGEITATTAEEHGRTTHVPAPAAS